MPKRTNYSFERREREKARAQKKADRHRIKRERSDQRKTPISDEADSVTSINSSENDEGID
tara:strand:+ start:184 stop:366 length:183 start_codon:yes stop_codon:yes gene_type:complete